MRKKTNGRKSRKNSKINPLKMNVVILLVICTLLVFSVLLVVNTLKDRPDLSKNGLPSFEWMTLIPPNKINASSIHNVCIRFSLDGDFYSAYSKLQSVYWFDMQKITKRCMNLTVKNLFPKIKDDAFELFIISTIDSSVYTKVTVQAGF